MKPFNLLRSIIKIRFCSYLFFTLGLTLPINDQLSTIAIIVTLAVSLGYGLYKKDYISFSKRETIFLCIISSILLLRVFGVFIGDSSTAFKQLVRSLPVLLLPVLFYLNKKRKIEKTIYYGMLIGLMALFIFLEFRVVKSIIINKEPIEYFLRWRYLNYNFLGELDYHPAYLGLFIALLLYYTLFFNFIGQKLKGLIIALLFVFLFQLVARNAIIVALIFLTLYLFYLKRKRPLFIYFTVLVTIFLFVSLHPSNYLREKFFNIKTQEFQMVENNRFIRLSASFDVFKRAPFFGVGPGNDNVLRRESYLKMNDMVAYNNNYNAHNQFVEFLSTYGIFGFLLFCFILFFLTYKIYKTKNKILFLLLFAFVLSCMSESILERSMGIKYFGLIVGIIWWHLLNSKNETNIFNGSRT